MSSNLLNDTSKTDILFKKYQGYPNTAVGLEGPKGFNSSAIPYIMSSNIYNQEIPKTAPSLTTSEDFNYLNSQGVEVVGATKKSSTIYPYLVKYENLLLKNTTEAEDFSFYFEGYKNVNEKYENLLTQIIPGNYDKLNGYAITVYDFVNNKSIAPERYILDRDAGLLTFYGINSELVNDKKPPRISFWRYEGTLGVSNFSETSKIALGSNAGQIGQGTNAIAIGANTGQSNQPDNSIMLNATGSDIIGATGNAFYVKPIRNDNTTVSRFLTYEPSTGEIISKNTVAMPTLAYYLGGDGIIIGGKEQTLKCDTKNNVLSIDNPNLIYDTVYGSLSYATGGATGPISVLCNFQIALVENQDGQIEVGIYEENIPTSNIIFKSNEYAKGRYNSYTYNFTLDVDKKIFIKYKITGAESYTIKGGDTKVQFTQLSYISGVIGPSGSNWGDYLYWNNNTGVWTVGSGSKISLGAGQVNQNNNSIVINATGSSLTTGSNNALYISPIRSNITASGATGLLLYNNTTKEITYNTTKTFVIDHPLHKDKYLVHSCLEGPEAGVYYRGISNIPENENYTTVCLPDYVSSFTTEPTPHITPIFNGKIRTLNSSLISGNSFQVYGEPGEFSWIVYAKRQYIEVEPLKSLSKVSGDGPYKYIL